MTTQEHILIFDIGKTNKKILVFDKAYQVVHRESTQFEEVLDEDGFPCDNLAIISHWVKERFMALHSRSDLNITKVNFSTYGASWVHLNHQGEAVSPLYNYLKSFPEGLMKILDEHHSLDELTAETASPFTGMLNSGFQLYWIKHCKPQLFSQIRTSLHFPQYLSYLFTNEEYSEHTSVGCHTALWDFQKNTYHKWVHEEGIDQLQAPIVSSSHSKSIDVQGTKIDFGPGIHDSSASLLPYLKASSEPFVLLSTGTWCVALNPFAAFEKSLSADNLCYRQIDGSRVKAARLFLGNEHDLQVQRISEYFKVAPAFLQGLQFDQELYQSMEMQPDSFFRFESMQRDAAIKAEQWKELQHVEAAYHRLVYDLVQLQKKALNQVIEGTQCRKVYIDGGFAQNQIFTKTLANTLPELSFFTSKAAMGTSIGAALVLDRGHFTKEIFKQIFSISEVIV